MSAPTAIAEPGWEPVQPFPSPEGAFLAENDHVRLAYFRKPGQPTLYAKAWFGAKTTGPPGHVHGGAIAAALDEAMGAAAWMNEHRSVAATITISFLEMLPIESETTIDASIERIEGRKIYLQANLKSPSGQLVATGTGLFVVLRDDRLQTRVNASL